MPMNAETRYRNSRHKTDTVMHRVYFSGLRPESLDTRIPLEWSYGTPRKVPLQKVIESDRQVVRKRARLVATGFLFQTAVLYGVLWAGSEVLQHIDQERAKGAIHDGTRTEAEGIPPIDNPLSTPDALLTAGALAVTFSLVGGAYAYKQESIDTQIRRMAGVAKRSEV